MDKGAVQQERIQEEGIDFKGAFHALRSFFLQASLPCLCVWDTTELLDHFVEVQRRHQEHRRKAYKEALTGGGSGSERERTSTGTSSLTSSSSQVHTTPARPKNEKKKSIAAVPGLALTQLFRSQPSS